MEKVDEKILTQETWEFTYAQLGEPKVAGEFNLPNSSAKVTVLYTLFESWREGDFMGTLKCAREEVAPGEPESWVGIELS